MPQRSRLDLVDQIIEGGVANYLRGARDEGKSFEAIAAELAHVHQIPATGRTIARWCTELHIERAAS